MARRRSSKALFKLPIIGKVTWVHLALAAGAFYLWRQSQSSGANAIVAANQPAPGWVPGGV